MPRAERNIQLTQWAEAKSYIDADGNFMQPVIITSTMESAFAHLRLTSLYNVTIADRCVVCLPAGITSLDGLTCGNNVTIDCRGVKTLGNAKFGDTCRLTQLNELRTVATATFGRECVLANLTDPVDLGTPQLTKAEMQLVRQISTRKCYMANWHSERAHCGTVHCLAGWAHMLTNKNWNFEQLGSAKAAGLNHLPGLAHLFYAFHAETSVRKMIKRLQALPE